VPYPGTPARKRVRSRSDETHKLGGPAVTFCPRVWVRVFQRTAKEMDCIWYSPRDMDAFKREAMERVLQYYSSQSKRDIVPVASASVTSAPAAGWGVVPTSAPATRLLFSHQALQVECDVLSRP
jgi:hypothetical protein